MREKGKRIPVAFTKDADPQDISDAIGEFLDRYDSERKTKMRYFGEVDLANGGYDLLLRLDISKNIGQFYAAASDTWKDTESAFKAPFDTTYYDELTEEQAFEIMEEQKATYYKC